MLVRYGLVMFKRMKLLVPSDVLTIRLPDGVLRGMRNRIALLVQEVNEVIAVEPIRTELIPRLEPKFSPVTVTTALVLAVCGETRLTQGEVTVSRNTNFRSHNKYYEGKGGGSEEDISQDFS